MTLTFTRPGLFIAGVRFSCSPYSGVNIYRLASGSK